MRSTKKYGKTKRFGKASIKYSEAVEQASSFTKLRPTQRIRTNDVPNPYSWKKVRITCVRVNEQSFVLRNTRTNRNITVNKTDCKRLGENRFVIKKEVIRKKSIEWASEENYEYKGNKESRMIDFSKKVHMGGIGRMF